MLKFMTKSSKFSDSFLRISLLSLAAITAVAGSAEAQTLNSDLAPAKTEARAKKTTKKTVRISRKSNRKAPFRETAVKKTPPPPAQTAPVTIENPGQIIERYMNYNQTSSVAPRDWESVIKQTTQILQTNPDDVTAKAQMLIAQGELAYNRGDYSNALVQFNAASQVLPNSALPSYGLGKVYLITKQPAEAENAFEKSIKLNKSFALAYKGMGDALTAQGKTKKAGEYFADAAKVGVSSGNLYTNPAGASNNRSAAENNLPKNQANRQNLQKVQPGSPSAGQTAVQPDAYQTELKNAKLLTARKKWQESLDKLLPLAQTNPNADLYIAIGENYVGLEQMLSAQQAFRKATEFSPNSALAFYRTGQVLFEMNEYKAAAESFEKSLILDQRGSFINRREARRMADKANEKARNPDGRKKFLNIL